MTSATKKIVRGSSRRRLFYCIFTDVKRRKAMETHRNGDQGKGCGEFHRKCDDLLHLLGSVAVARYYVVAMQCEESEAKREIKRESKGDVVTGEGQTVRPEAIV